MKTRLVILSFFFLLTTAVVVSLANKSSTVFAQSNTPQDELIKAQIENYRAETAKINAEHGFWSTVVGLGTFFAALVALITFVLNYSATLQTQRDTQFYEALKRFGDQRSPTLRSSAAGIVAEMALSQPTRFQRIIRYGRSSEYFDTAVNQLVAGLLLEENDVALNSIANALERLVSSPLKLITRVHEANLKLQTDMLEAISRYFSTKVADPYAALLLNEHWNELAAATPYEEEVIHDVARRHREPFIRLVQASLSEFNTLTPKRQPDYLSEALQDMKLASHKLLANVKIYSAILRSNPYKEFNSGLDESVDRSFQPKSRLMDLSNVFLVNADLQKSNLRGVKLENAQLQQASLWTTDLKSSFLEKAYLQGAQLGNANLEKSRLFQARLEPLELRDHDGQSYYSAATDLGRANLKEADLRGASLVASNLFAAELWRTKTDESTKLKKSNWWDAVFSKTFRSEEIDSNLLDTLFELYGDSAPADVNSIYHSAVRTFMTERQAKKNQQMPVNKSSTQ